MIDFELTPSDIADALGSAFRLTPMPTEDGFCFSLPMANEPRNYYLSNKRLHDLFDKLRAANEVDETILYTDHTCEVLVRNHSRLPLRALGRQRDLQNHDPDRSLRYQVGSPSDLYILFLLHKMTKLPGLRMDRYGVGLGRLAAEAVSDGDNSALELYAALRPHFVTVRVESAKALSIDRLRELTSAYLFQISYNLDIALVPQRHLDELFRAQLIRSLRRARPEEVEPPQRLYTEDTVYHYQMGVSADNPVLEYLSYYHVAEHFFWDVFNRDFIARVRKQITGPQFSSRRDVDIKSLIRTIKKELISQRSEEGFREQGALELTLKEYVDLDSLKHDVEGYDSELLDYYRSEEVPFSKGARVNIEGDEPHAIRKALAHRIYQTRNAIVHSKEDLEKPRYKPFQHERILIREVPLLRLIAEQIIVGSSRLMD